MEEIARQSGDDENVRRECTDGQALIEGDMARCLLECSRSSLALLEQGGVIVDCNSSFATLLGSTGDQLVGDRIWNHLTSGISDLCKEKVAAVFECGEGCCFEDEQDGVWLEYRVTPVSKKKGVVESVVLEVVDVTRRKVAEEQLRKERKLTDVAINSHQDTFFLLDFEEGKALRWNRAFSELTGYSDEEIGELPAPQSYYSPDDLRRIELFMPEMFSAGIGSIELDLICKNGRRVPTEYNVAVIKDEENSRRYLVSIGRDITERKQTIEALYRRLVTLTQPGQDVGDVEFEDLVDLESIQRLQDEFAAATGVASLITRTDGTPITAPSSFCRLCIDIIRKTEKGRANCFRSDAALGRYNPDGPNIQPCMSGGFWDAGAAITVGGKHVANWLIGQVRDDTQTEEQMRAYAREIGADEQDFIKAFNEVPAMSRERFGQVAQVLFTLANQLSAMAYQNVLQARFITDRERAEKALRESEDRYRTLVENAPEAIIVLDADAGVFVDMNENAENLFGLSRAEILKIGPVDVSPEIQPDGRTSVEAAKEEVGRALDGQIQLLEWTHINRKSGEEIPCEVRLVRLPASDRSLVRGSVIDITDRKRAEEALKESEATLAKSQEIAHVGSWKFGTKKNELIWSDEVYRIFGLEPRGCPESYESFLGMVHPDDRSRVDDTYKHAVENGIDGYEIEHRVIRQQSGEIRHVHEKCIFLRDSNNVVERAFGIVQDITERKKSEEALCCLRNYLSNIIDSMPSLLIGVDSEGRVTQWNGEAAKATGITAEKAEGMLLSDAFPRLAGEMGRVHEAMEMEEVRYDAKHAHNVEGETRYEDVTVYPLSGHGVEGAVIRVDDVTERVRIEEMMVQAEKMLSVGGLAAGMAHEINNPLGGMMQAAQNIERRVSASLPVNEQVAKKCGTTLEAVRSYLEERDIFNFLKGIRDCGSRAAGIVTNMLQFSRKSIPQLVQMDVAELIDRSVELAEQDYDLKKKYDFRHIDVVREYDPSTPCVYVVDTEIEQVIFNLLRNSAQAMQDNPPDKPPRLVLRTMPDEAMVRIEIEDNGSGIPEDIRKRVFEPFFTTKNVGEGTGLGLSVSYMIITQNHDGQMSVESTPGEGTKFIVKLPAHTS